MHKKGKFNQIPVICTPNILSLVLAEIIFPVFKFGALPSDIILWILFLLTVALSFVAIIHEKGGILIFRLEG